MQDTPNVTNLSVYDLNESDADSDYDIKPQYIAGTTTTCPPEDLADDEREDTSEAEQEPEPDYDDDDDEPTGMWKLMGKGNKGLNCTEICSNRF